MREVTLASALKAVDRDLQQALGRIDDLSALLGEAADRIEEADPRYARELRNRAFTMAFVDRSQPPGRRR